METRKILGLFAGSIFMILLFLNATTSNVTVDTDFATGEEVYKANCMVCHQATGAGILGAFPPIAKSDYFAKMSKTDAITIVLKGKTGEIKVNGTTYNSVMAPLERLSDQDIASVLTYISNNFGNEGHSYKPADVKKVRASLK